MNRGQNVILIVRQSYWFLLKSIKKRFQEAGMLTSCLNGFKVAVINMDKLVVKQMAQVKRPLSPGEATRGCRTAENDEIRLVHPPVSWASAVIRINKDIMMAMPAARGYFPRKRFLSSAQQAPLQRTCVWLTEALIWPQPSERNTNYAMFASTLIDSDMVFDRKRAIKLQLWGTNCYVSD